MTRNLSVDALRALGAVLVFAFHAGHLFARGIPFGWIGVPLFFVVSGYLICGRLLDLSDRALPLGAALRSFYWRRALRIFPVYWLFLLIVTGLALSSGAEVQLHALPYAWTHTSNFFNASSAHVYNPVLDPTWSLAVEEQFYLLFPLVVLLLGRGRLLPVLIAMIVAGPILRLVMSSVVDQWPQAFDDKPHAIYMLGFTHVDAFAFGALINLMPRAWCQRLGSLRCLVPVVLFTIAVSALATGQTDSAFFLGFLQESGGHLIWGYTLVNLVSMLLLCRAIGDPRAALGRATAPMAVFGQWSYSFYLIHFPTIAVVGGISISFFPGALPGWLALVIAFCVATVLARLMYETVEKPAQALRGLMDRPEPAASRA